MEKDSGVQSRADQVIKTLKRLRRSVRKYFGGHVGQHQLYNFVRHSAISRHIVQFYDTRRDYIKIILNGNTL